MKNTCEIGQGCAQEDTHSTKLVRNYVYACVCVRCVYMCMYFNVSMYIPNTLEYVHKHLVNDKIQTTKAGT